jgi:hypothetical protein
MNDPEHGAPDFLLWIDSDTVPTITGFQKLMEVMHQRPEVSAISAWYLRNTTPPEICAKKLSSDQWMTLKDLKDSEPGQAPIELSEVGFGFILIRSQVFKDLEPFSFQPIVNADQSVGGEDVSFCIRARKKGHQIFLSPKVYCDHMKLAPVPLPIQIPLPNCATNGPEQLSDDSNGVGIAALGGDCQPTPKGGDNSGSGFAISDDRATFPRKSGGERGEQSGRRNPLKDSANSEILVLTGAYTSDESRWAALRESAYRHNVPLVRLGEGTEYRGMEGIQDSIDFLKTREERYIVATDAYDVIVNRWNPEEVKRMIDSAPDLIMSVEHWTWPQGPWAGAYKHLNGRYAWYAINGGQYAGRREQIINMWECMLIDWRAGKAPNGGSSQEILHQYFGERGPIEGKRVWPFTLDLECRLFQSMYGPPAQFIRLQTLTAEGHSLLKPKALNTVTSSVPMFLHFNGGAPGLAQWAEKLKGEPQEAYIGL